MSGFRQIVKFFNSKKSNKLFTRNEYFLTVKDLKMKDSYKDTIRCYLVNAGYLKTEEAGVYRKLKKIPSELTVNRLKDEAYPDSAAKRKAMVNEIRSSK